MRLYNTVIRAIQKDITRLDAVGTFVSATNRSVLGDGNVSVAIPSDTGREFSTECTASPSLSRSSCVRRPFLTAHQCSNKPTEAAPSFCSASVSGCHQSPNSFVYSTSDTNLQMAARRADEAASRLQKRLELLKQKKHISALPPVVRGGALVIPRSLLRELTEQSTPSDPSQGETCAVELAAMQAVMDIERQFGFNPRDVSAAKRGYDIESHIPEDLRSEATASLRFIKVKGRLKGATTVTKNAILTALNKPNKFFLAIAEVDGDTTHATYVKKPFHATPNFTSRSVTYDIADLLAAAEVVYSQTGSRT